MPKIELSKVIVHRKTEEKGGGREHAMEIAGSLPHEIRIAILRDEK